MADGERPSDAPTKPYSAPPPSYPPLLPNPLTPIPTSLTTLNLSPVPLLSNYDPLFVSLLL